MSTESLLDNYVKEQKAKNASGVRLGVLNANAFGAWKEKLAGPFPKISISLPPIGKPSEPLAFTVPKRKESSCFPALSRTQRFLGFGFTFSAGVISLCLVSNVVPSRPSVESTQVWCIVHFQQYLFLAELFHFAWPTFIHAPSLLQGTYQLHVALLRFLASHAVRLRLGEFEFYDCFVNFGQICHVS
ncbi:hypothetical protein D918_08986 [Trichuris suis]|nr:hypothetical protein D918_08986 [Trichuris suis]